MTLALTIIKATDKTSAPKELLVLSHHKDISVLCAVAGNHSTPGTASVKLAKSEFSQVRSILAGNPNISNAAFAILIGDGDVDVLIRLSCNPSLPVKYFDELSNHPEEYVRSGIASQVRCPQYLMIKFIYDVSPMVQWIMADNTATPELILSLLALHIHFRVRSFVGFNFNTPCYSLTKLSVDSHEKVRTSVAGNSSSTYDIIHAFVSDPCFDVRCAIAQSSQLKTGDISILSQDEHANVRAEIAKRHDLSPRVIIRLSLDESLLVRLALAENIAISTFILHAICEIDVHEQNGESFWHPVEAEVINRIISHPNVLKETLVMINKSGCALTEKSKQIMQRRC